MRVINWLIDRIAISGLVVASAVLCLPAIIVPLSILFNFSPYFTFGSSRAGIVDYAKGIPVAVDVSVSIPDTCILIKNKDGTVTTDNRWTDFPRPYSRDHLDDSTVLHVDTIITEYNLHTFHEQDVIIIDNTHQKKPRQGMHITDLDFDSGTAYIKTNSRIKKLAFSLPFILKYLVLGYCAWQLAMLLSFIQSGEAFVSRNYRRLSKVGWAVIGLYLVLFLYEIFLKPFSSMHVSFSGSISGYYSPYQINAQPMNDIGIVWLIAGCIILIVANAFRKGFRLQQEQDLTV